MQISFTKYHGTGNDFILIDNRNGNIVLQEKKIAFLCHRQFGIGADGLMFLFSSEKYDFEMKYFNSDGGEGSMCGNGGRCITAFAKAIGLIDQNARFMAIDGVHESKILSESARETFVSLKMKDVENVEIREGNYIINTGSPHCIKFVENVELTEVFTEGKKIRWDEQFQPDGINVNFVEIKNDHIIVRSFERGVENITLSCGTGVTAASIATAVFTNTSPGKIKVKTDGGDLLVRFNKNKGRFTDIFLEGPAVKVFDGIIDI